MKNKIETNEPKIYLQFIEKPIPEIFQYKVEPSKELQEEIRAKLAIEHGEDVDYEINIKVRVFKKP